MWKPALLWRMDSCYANKHLTMMYLANKKKKKKKKSAWCQPCIRTSFSTDWPRNAAKSFTLWALKKTPHVLLMPWVFVAYTLLYNTSWPSWHSVNSTNNASLPKVKVMANGILLVLLQLSLMVCGHKPECLKDWIPVFLSQQRFIIWMTV